MAYTVLARKYRSRTFDEVIGQQPIATTLVHAIQAARIHHAYLFTGTRGVGKTSMARILAKALNCLKAEGPTITPCCECDACAAIAEGQDIDVIEIDAASNTGVDNIRELRSNTAYRPARSRFKVYIIDEVHMLSTGAFNALLKTLEEPPEHVKFILATTEVHKVPATIQSRCQRFNFRNISPDDIAARLATIVQQEGAQAEPIVLRRLARLANGSMRDALSILDQLLSVSPTNLTAALLDELVPPPQDEQILALLRHAADGDAAAVLADAETILAHGRGLEVFCHDAIDVLRALMLVRACGPDTPMVDVPAAARDEYVALSRRFELSQYVQMVAMLEELRRNARYSGAGRALCDALLVRLAHMHTWAPIEQLIAQVAPGAAATDEKKKPAAPESEPEAPARALPVAAGLRPGRTARPPDAIPDRATPPTLPTGVPRSRFTPEPRASDLSDIAYAPNESVEIPDDYRAPEALADAPGKAAAPGSISSEERAKILKDPVVKAVLDLFDGELVYVARPPPAVTEHTAE